MVLLIIPRLKGVDLNLNKRNYHWKVVLLLGAMNLLSSCTSLSKLNLFSDKKPTETIDVHNAEIESFRASEKELPELEVPEFNEIPEEMQVHVNKWMNYFQGKGREHMERYLSRSTRYERLMKRILRENGIPEDIIYIALIESGFSPRAISRSRAVGYWQFIRGTGKKFGLAINTFVDERRDPVLATQAAADYFKGLYGEFNSWFLSMASYNVGEGRVRREINRNKTRDFWALVKKRRLPKETLNYVPKFLAARLIAKKPEAYGFKDIPYEPPIEFETARFQQSVNMKVLADKLNVDYAELKRLNPKFRGEIAPIDSNRLELRLPLNTKDAALALANEIAVKDLVFVPDRGETDVYKVRAGDTLLKVAKKFKTNVAFLREINDFKRRSYLRPGRTIFVPIPAVAMPKPPKVDSSNEVKVATALPEKKSVDDTTTSSSVSEAKDVKPIVASPALYAVQEGESLAEIATKNNMTMEELMELNSFTEGQVISAGMQLKVKKIQPDNGEPSIDDLPSSTAVAKKATSVKPITETTTTTTTPKSQSVEAKTDTAVSVEAPTTSNPVAASESPNTVIAEGIKKELTGSSETVKELLHKVQPGETLFKIAQQYNTTVSAIKKVNKLRRRRLIRAGAILKIPNSSSSERKTTDSSFYLPSSSGFKAIAEK